MKFYDISIITLFSIVLFGLGWGLICVSIPETDLKTAKYEKRKNERMQDYEKQKKEILERKYRKHR